MATEGLLLASRDLGFLLRCYACNAAACFATLLLAGRMQWGLQGVWLVLIQARAEMGVTSFPPCQPLSHPVPAQFHLTRLAVNGHRVWLSPASPLRAAAVQ